MEQGGMVVECSQREGAGIDDHLEAATNVAGTEAALRRIGELWSAAGIQFHLAGERDVKVSAARGRREQAIAIAADALRQSGWRVCLEHTLTTYLFAFGPASALRLDFGPRNWWSRWHIPALRPAPGIGLVGPETAGRSTVLELVEQWLEREAPFLEITRRKPGLVQDRRSSRRSRLTIYEGAQKPPRGSRLLAGFGARPEMTILLADDPAREQLAADRRIDAVVQMNSEPEEIAARVLDVLLDGFIRANDPAPQPGIEVLIGGAREALNFGGAPDQFLAAPGRRSPRFLIPASNRKLAADALEVFHAQHPKGKAAQSATSLGVRVGIVQALVRERIPLALPERFRPAAISLGTDGPDQRPVLQIMRADGSVAAHAKVGWSERSIELVRNEEAALRRIGGQAFTTAIVPHLLEAGWLDGRYFILQSAIRRKLAPSPSRIDARHLQFLFELVRTDRVLGFLPWPHAAQIEELKAGFPYYAHLLALAGRFCAGRPSVPCGPSHGDFTPRNILQLDDRLDARLVIFDWEHARTNTPVGWDLFHFAISTAVEKEGLDAAAIYPRLRGFDKYFADAGVTRDGIDPILVSYLADTLARSLSALGTNVSAADAKLRRVWAGLLVGLVHPAAEAERSPEVTEWLEPVA